MINRIQVLKTRVMRYIILLLMLSSVYLFAQEDKREFVIEEGDRSFVMKQYVMCLLKRGPNRGQSDEEAKVIQSGHLNHINQMADSGYILVAGPFGDDGDLRGILVYDVPSVEKAKELQSADPAIISGRLIAEFHPWWTSKEGSFK